MSYSAVLKKQRCRTCGSKRLLLNRVTSLRIRLAGKEELCIIRVYAPTSDHDDDEVEAFYEEAGHHKSSGSTQIK